MNADRVISKINHNMNAFNESGGREDKACAEGLRIARTYIQQEVLKRKILTHDQQVVLEWWVKKLNEEGEDADPLGVICAMQSYGLHDETIYDAAVNLTPAQQFQVLAAFAEWGLSNA